MVDNHGYGFEGARMAGKAEMDAVYKDKEELLKEDAIIWESIWQNFVMQEDVNKLRGLLYNE